MFVPLAHPPGHAQADFGEADAIVLSKMFNLAEMWGPALDVQAGVRAVGTPRVRLAW